MVTGTLPSGSVDWITGPSNHVNHVNQSPGHTDNLECLNFLSILTNNFFQLNREEKIILNNFPLLGLKSFENPTLTQSISETK